MIFDLVQRSLTSKRVLIPVEELFGDSRGSRLPEVVPERLTHEIAQRIADACTTSAMVIENTNGATTLKLDYGECVGCMRCVDVSEGSAIPARTFVRCGVRKVGLVKRWDLDRRCEIGSEESALAEIGDEIRSLVGRALNIRQLDAGSCNGCEAEIVALNNPYYDLERFGIHFVASPKHADMLLVTGPVTRNMAEAVKNTYDATPCPKLVVAVGVCGCSGGIFSGGDCVVGGVDSVIPVDGYVPGCPPTPAMLLTGILQLLQQTRQPD